MSTHNHTQQPLQPPKQAAYNQAQNPITHTPLEQRANPPSKSGYQHSGGGPASSITRRTADSKPSSDEALAEVYRKHHREERGVRAPDDVDLGYGVEQQPREGEIAAAVKKKGRGGWTGVEEKGFGADMERKREDHERVLGERVGQSPPTPDGETVEREMLRRRKLEQERRLDVKGAVREATGDPVV